MASDKRLSVNKLGEYMTATPSRRRQIIKDQKTPSTFKVARYNDARDVIVDYLTSGMSSDTEAMERAEELLSNSGRSEFTEQDRALSAEAIESFLKVSDEIDIHGLQIESADSFSDQSLEIGDVSVTMRPDAILRDEITGKIVGGVKLHFPKTYPLNDKGCEYVATALRFHLEGQDSPKSVDPKKCYVVDVHTQKVRMAPKAYKRCLSDIVAACEEISARWDSI
ncbi:MAG: hypothetical protein WCV67_01005 [Victivallaceae bacterium]|jgi:hypothetical protein